MMMKNVVAAAALIASLLGSGPAAADPRTVTLNVSGMTCMTCPPQVKKALSTVNGVQKVEVSLATNTAVVTFDDATCKLSDLTEATTKIGYPSTVKK